MKNRLDANPIVALAKLLATKEFNGIIKKVGYQPFYVHYWSNTQIHVFRRYCNNNYSR